MSFLDAVPVELSRYGFLFNLVNIISLLEPRDFDFIVCRWMYEQEQAEKTAPSEARMYYETRKRTVGREYKTSYDVIEDNIKKMEGGQSQQQRKLLGRCTKKVKRPSNSSVLIPDEFLEPYRAQIVKDTAAEIMRTLKQQLPSEIFSRISFEDQSDHLVNDVQQCLGENGDNEVNHQEDLEGHEEN